MITQPKRKQFDSFALISLVTVYAKLLKSLITTVANFKLRVQL